MRRRDLIANGSGALDKTAAASIAGRIGTFAAGVDISQLDPIVVETARLSLIDTVGVMIVGAREPLSILTAAHAIASRGAGRCRIVAQPNAAASPLAAALANGVATHVLDFDDTIYDGIAHASAPVLPALLAAAETSQATGTDVLAGLIAGIETAAALGRAFTPEIYDRGVWTTAFLGVIASAAGAARTLRLDADAATRAVSLAAGQAIGSRAVMGTDAKPYLCGRAAEAGLDAAFAARAGFTAPAHIIDGRFGLTSLINAVQFDAAGLDGLGRGLLRPITGYKQFPICSAAQAAAEAVQMLARQHEIGPRDVEKVECLVTPFVASCLPYTAPHSRTEAQFSLNFAVACSLINGSILPAHLAGEEFEKPAIVELMSRVTSTVDKQLVPEADAALCFEAARVEIVTRAGSRHGHTLLSAAGMPPNRATFGLIATKFMANVSPSLGADGQMLLSRLRQIEAIDDVGDLMGMMAPCRC